MSKPEILAAYRWLYRAGLKAVKYSKPARYNVRDIMRDSFRNQPSAAYDAARISNTLSFLDRASEYRGMEHKILKNIAKIRWHRHNAAFNGRAIKQQTELAAAVRKTMWSHFDATLAMLNETEHLCLRS